MKILVLLLSLLWLSACSTKPYIVKETYGELAAGNKKIYVLSHGWHTSLVIPAEDLEGDLPELKNRFGNTPYIEFGWGDKGFYQAEKVTTGLTLRALFWPSAAIIHRLTAGSVMRYIRANNSALTTTSHRQSTAVLRFAVSCH